MKTRVQSFQNLIWNFYKKNKRDLPWRRNITPYRVVVSEVMLQQTQAARVAPKFLEFVKCFPSFRALAAAPVAEVLKMWSGLGYYRRALHLKKLAEIVIKEHKGKLPDTLDELVKLPAIGPNTAGAILAYAFDKPAAYVETNIRKIYLHHFFSKDDRVADQQLLSVIAKTLPKKNIREWYQTLMDYGTYLAQKVANPNTRSRHYTKQSRFEGSVRQLRGQVIKALLGHSSVTLMDLKKQLDDKRLAAVLKSLEIEGFVVMKNGFVSIKK